MITDELRNAKPLQGKERLGASRDSDYMGVEDIEPETEPVLTISALYNAIITLARGKERHDVITFVEETVPGSIKMVRPLVVNATNRKMLRKLYKEVTADTLVGKKIQLYIDPTVRNPQTKEIEGGIRIKSNVPKSTNPAKKAIKCADCGKEIKPIGTYSAEQVAQMNQARYGRTICGDCSKKLKEEAEKAAQTETQDNSLADALTADIKTE